jgi:peptidase MA superfamily protein
MSERMGMPNVRARATSARARATSARARSLVALVLAAGIAAAGTPFATVVRAAGVVSFGAPTIHSTFQVGIDVEEPVTLPAAVHRIEALVHTGSDTRVLADDVPLPAGAGPTSLTYHIDAPPGQLLPNTLVQVHFRVTLADGTAEEGPIATVRYEDTRFAWKTLTGTIVRVHWAQGDDAFGQRALQIGDKAVADTSRLLGVTETSPIDFFIYPDTKSFYDVLGPAARENVGGVAFPDIRTLLANIGPNAVNDAWVGTVIPHELTHLVFGTAVDNPYHAPPHWFNEGLAVYLSQGYDSGDRSEVANAVGNGSIMPLAALDGQFPTTADRFSLAYAESVSAIDYLIRTYGQAALVTLIHTWGGGVADDEAFHSALGVDVAGFQAGWLKGIGAPEPRPAGPKPAPPGPVPPGWPGGAAVVPGAVSSPSGDASATDLLVEGIVVVVIAFLGIGLVWFLAKRRRLGTGPT